MDNITIADAFVYSLLRMLGISLGAQLIVSMLMEHVFSLAPHVQFVPVVVLSGFWLWKYCAFRRYVRVTTGPFQYPMIVECEKGRRYGCLVGTLVGSAVAVALLGT